MNVWRWLKPHGPPGTLPSIKSVIAMTCVSILNLAFFEAIW